MHDTIIILAGGMSSRMKSSTDSGNMSAELVEQANERDKGLIGLAGEARPFLDLSLANIKLAGYENVYIITGEDDTLFREFYGSETTGNKFNGLVISYAMQKLLNDRVKPFGTADALLQAMEQYPVLHDSSFTVCNSDNLYSVDALSAIRTIEHPNAWIDYDRDSLKFSSEKIARFAVTDIDDNYHLLGILEKPDTESIQKMELAHGRIGVSMNLFKFDGHMIYPFLENCPVNEIRDEKELPTAILNMTNDIPGSMKGIPFAEHVPDLTEKDDISETIKYLTGNQNSINEVN